MILISVIAIICLTVNADPGDTIVGKTHAIWRVATFSDATFADGIVAYMHTSMAAMPSAYLANADIQEWTGWLRITLIQAFPSNVFPQEVYNAIVYATDYYQYGTPQIKDAYAPPTCTVNVDDILCDENPTGDGREVLLWRYVSSEFVEQDPVASGYTIELAAGTWTIGPLPSVGNLVVAYDDNFTSFPTLFMTIP